jgi:hypothetical protein
MTGMKKEEWRHVHETIWHRSWIPPSKGKRCGKNFTMRCGIEHVSILRRCASIVHRLFCDKSSEERPRLSRRAGAASTLTVLLEGLKTQLSCSRNKLVFGCQQNVFRDELVYLAQAFLAPESSSCGPIGCLFNLFQLYFRCDWLNHSLLQFFRVKRTIQV